MTTRLLSTWLIALALAAPAAAAPVIAASDGQRGTAAAAPGNLPLFRDVQRQVLRYPNLTIFDSVHIGVHDGVVTLTGDVTMPYKSRDLERRVARVAGVTQVVNRIGVLPVSIFDNDIRVRLARSIYGNPNFWRYASMANPPIQIIVRNGHVTLEGVVNSEVDRMLARAVANQWGVFSFTNNLKTDAEARALLEKL